MVKEVHYQLEKFAKIFIKYIQVDWGFVECTNLQSQLKQLKQLRQLRQLKQLKQFKQLNQFKQFTTNKH